MLAEPTVTVEIRVQRLWLVRANAACWCVFGRLFPFADPEAVADQVARLAVIEMRIGGRGPWQRVQP